MKMGENTKTNSINDAYAEVYDIILHMEMSLRKKIPYKFIEVIKENRNINYNINIDYRKSIIQQNILYDTKVILSVIYRDFLVDNETKLHLKKKDQLTIEEKYSYNDIFNKNKIAKPKIDSSPKQEKSLIEIKHKKWYEKLFSFFRNMFKK